MKINYRFVCHINGKMERFTWDAEELTMQMQMRGYQRNGELRNNTARQELQGQPKFMGVAGPFWKGDAVRYESWKVCNELST